MFCKNCGAQCNEGAKFCPACGTDLTPPTAPEQPAYQQPAQPVYQQPVMYQQPAQPVYQQPVQVIYQPVVQVPMKWFKFMIYFVLFASAVICLSNGIRLMTGAVYEDSADLMYAMFDGLQILDIIVGALMVGMAALSIYARFRLAGYYKDGPKMLTYVYVADIAVSLIYLIGLAIVAGGDLVSELFVEYVPTMAYSVALIFANYSYFKKRECMFTK